MGRLRRGQGAMEYLMSYGWAILVIAIVGIIMWQSNILSSKTSSMAPTVSGGQFIKVMAANSEMRLDVWGNANIGYDGFITTAVNTLSTPMSITGLNITVDGRYCENMLAWNSPPMIDDDWNTPFIEKDCDDTVCHNSMCTFDPSWCGPYYNDYPNSIWYDFDTLLKIPPGGSFVLTTTSTKGFHDANPDDPCYGRQGDPDINIIIKYNTTIAGKQTAKTESIRVKLDVTPTARLTCAAGCPAGQCMTNGVCCNPGILGCGGICCATGETCSQTGDGAICCPAGQTACAGSWGTPTCCASGTTCSHSGDVAVCCGGGQAGCTGTWGSPQCCNSGESCGGNFGGALCCPSGKTPCMGNWYGGNCCNSGETCVKGDWTSLCTTDPGTFACNDIQHTVFCTSGQTCYGSPSGGGGICCSPGQTALFWWWSEPHCCNIGWFLWNDQCVSGCVGTQFPCVSGDGTQRWCCNGGETCKTWSDWACCNC